MHLIISDRFHFSAMFRSSGLYSHPFDPWNIHTSLCLHISVFSEFVGFLFVFMLSFLLILAVINPFYSFKCISKVYLLMHLRHHKCCLVRFQLFLKDLVIRHLSNVRLCAYLSVSSFCKIVYFPLLTILGKIQNSLQGGLSSYLFIW